MQDYDEATSAATVPPRVLDPCCGSPLLWIVILFGAHKHVFDTAWDKFAIVFDQLLD